LKKLPREASGPVKHPQKLLIKKWYNDNMELIKLYTGFEEAFFVERDNRFVMQLKKTDGRMIKAYVANPGRMEEFLVPGTPSSSPAEMKENIFIEWCPPFTRGLMYCWIPLKSIGWWS
jgi:hypothetical protein